MANEKKNIEKAKLTFKEKAAKAWNWTKDHAVPIALGALAIGGGAYAYARSKRNGGDEAPACGNCDWGQPDSDDIREKINQAWDECENSYDGPTED